MWIFLAEQEGRIYMNILSIGNSFSYDAARYLHQIARSDGTELNCANIHIGGCSLWRHYVNAMDETKKYGLQYNGMDTMFNVTMKEALINREWDIITLQQVSIQSVDYQTYQPYLDFIKEYVKKYCPKAKIYIHQTWEYGKEHTALKSVLGYDEPSQMLADIRKVYNEAANAIDADGIIPSGELIGLLVTDGIKIHRDDQHVSLGLGRYALGLLWYAYLTGRDVANNTFADFDEAIEKKYILRAKECVAAVLRKQK